MYQAFFINLAIVTTVLSTALITGEPACLMGLLLLQPMPLIVPGIPPDDDDDEPKIGFNADL